MLKSIFLMWSLNFNKSKNKIVSKYCVKVMLFQYIYFISQQHNKTLIKRVFNLNTKLLSKILSFLLKVGEKTTKEVVHCKCSHLTFFGGSIFVAPNSIHPINDLHLLMNLRDNPLVFSLVTLLLVLYVILLIWSRFEEKRDKLKVRL